MNGEAAAGAGKPAYLDTSLSFEERARDLVSRMTLEEKAAQMMNSAPANERLGIPEHDWWNEGLHGVARAGVATVFPQAIGLAAMWDSDFMFEVATAISDEARAMHHEYARRGDRGQYKGLTYWSPNINIFRDPRWGRGHETYGEDPCLTGTMGVAFVKGLQGDDPKYLKLVATPKHFAVHSGPELERHHFDARVSPKDLRETYLPAFHQCIKEGRAYSIMSAYNRVNGEPCSASKTLLIGILREEWGFEGYVVSDCGAIHDIHANHKVTSSPEESAALAVSNGCDLSCGCVFTTMPEAVKQGLVAEEVVDRALERLMVARMKLGMFDPEGMVPFASIPYEVKDSPEHRHLALEAARKSIVLLKNDGVLPLPHKVKSIAVIGPNADSKDVLLGNYNGVPSRWVTVLRGIEEKLAGDARIYYSEGCPLTGESRKRFSEAMAIAERSDVIVACLGLSPRIEGEEGEVADSDGGGDRKHLNLPGLQEELLQKLVETGKPVIVVLLNGSAVAINWAMEHVPAVVEAWYPGEEGGTAIADVLFGDYNPAGRLPVTFYKGLEQVPPFDDYRMAGRTYRFFEDEPLIPFGFGLSYTHFEYSNLKLSTRNVEPGQDLQATVTVTNAGALAGEEVVQVYLKDVEASVRVPVRQLIAFRRIWLGMGESETLSFRIPARRMAVIDEEGKAVIEPGSFVLSVGGNQPDARSLALGASECAEAEFSVVGNPLEVEY